MSRAAVVRIDAARVVVEADDPPKLPRLWSARALAERLSVSRALIFALHRAGRLRGYRILTGSDEKRAPLRFAEADVLALIAEVQR
jgi:hypothetical protein